MKDVYVKTDRMEADVSFDRQRANVKNAQFMLDTQIMNDMKPYMPMQTGNFIQRTAAESMAIAGTGVVVAAAAPFGRFLYEGKVMVGEISGSAFAMPGEQKVVTNKDLNYYHGAHPEATAKWFEVAKQNHRASWLRLVKRVTGGV